MDQQQETDDQKQEQEQEQEQKNQDNQKDNEAAQDEQQGKEQQEEEQQKEAKDNEEGEDQDGEDKGDKEGENAEGDEQFLTTIYGDPKQAIQAYQDYKNTRFDQFVRQQAENRLQGDRMMDALGENEEAGQNLQQARQRAFLPTLSGGQLI